MNQPFSLPTTYNGVRFRSRLEANWARAFDDAGIKWDYEPEGWRFGNGLCYLPDFYLPDLRTIVEVKGILDDRSVAKLAALEEVTFQNGILLVLAESPAGDRWSPVRQGGGRGPVGTGFDICPDCYRRQFFDDGDCRVCVTIKRRTAADLEAEHRDQYTPEEWRQVCRWWAREMVRAAAWTMPRSSWKPRWSPPNGLV